MQKYKHSALRIEAVKEDKKMVGTGWLWYDSYTVITAKHVVGEANSKDVNVVVGEKKFSVKKIVRSQNNDLAMLFLKDSITSANVLKLSSDTFLEGQDLFGWGFGMSNETPILFKGTYTGTTDRFGLANIMVVPGHSGSAVLNDKGHVVGVAVMVSTEWQSLSLFESLTTLKSELPKLLSEK